MSVRSSQSITKVFTTRRFDTGAATNGDSTPTGTLYVNGTADGATVTVTNITTGVYKAAVTLPTLAVGDVVDIRISATVNSVTDNATIWTDIKDIVIDTAGVADANAAKILGTAVSTPATAGILDVNVKNMNNVAATSITTINANIGQTQPVNFTGTGASALVKGDTVDIAGAAVSTSSAQIGVNVVNAGGTAWASGSLTSSVFAAGAINAAAVADATIDRATFAVDTGLQTVRSNTAQTGASGTITLDASASATTDFYKGMEIYLTGGTGVGQYRLCTAYNSSTKVATITPAWATNPDNTSTFAVQARGMVDAEAWLGAVISTPTNAGVPNVNAKTWNDLTTVALPLTPTTAGRTLDVSTGGEAGLDWANIGSPTTTVALTGTTIAVTQKVDVDTIKTNPVVNAGTITFPTGATLASTTNITAGTITTATNVTTVNGLAAGTITAAAIADAAIDRATFAADTGLQSIRSNTAQAGASTSITLDASASATTDFYKGTLIYLTGGTGVGQYRLCTAYNGSTKVATVTPAWATNPASDSTFAVMPQGMVSAEALLGTAFVTPATAGIIDTNIKNINNVSASSVTTINANIGATQPINFTGTGGSALVKGDTVDIAGAAVSTSTAQIGVNVVNFGGSAGTFASGRPEVNTTHIAGSAVSTSSAQIGVNIVNAGGTAWASGSLTSGVFASGAITAAAIAADAIGASELAADALTEIRSLASGTSDSGTTTTMVDAARTEADTDYWKGSFIVFTSGNISGQARLITGFNASTDTITFAPATTQAVSTQTYEIWPAAPVDVQQWLQTTVSTPTVAGVPNVNVKTWNDLTTVALPLVPTTAGRTLDVSAGGEAGLDWANIGSPTTTVALTGTTIATTQKVDIETIKTNPVVNAGTVTFPTTATLASTTNITAGTITTVTNLTNAATSGDLTATMKTSVENAVWNAARSSHTTAGTYGLTLQDVRDGTAQAGAATTITLDASASATNSFYNNCLIELVGGTGVGQSRFITGYVGSTKVATVNSAWATNPDNTSIFLIKFFDAVPGASAPTAAQVATAVWQDTTSGDFTVSGSIGKSLFTSGAVPGAAGGLFIAGTNAATTITTALTTTFTGNLTGTIGNLASGAKTDVENAVWDATTTSHVAANTFGRGAQPVRESTAQAGAATTITLDASASASNSFYNNCLIKLIGGTGAGQSRFITGYVGSTKVATVNSSWVTNPDNTTTFSIQFFDAVPGASAPTAAQVATAVWQDTTSGDFTVSGSIGKSLFTSGVVPGGSGGLMISGSNSGTTTLGALTVSGATTLTGNVSMAAGLNITQSTADTAALVVTGNGTGDGAIFKSGSGATGNAITANAQSTNGNGISAAKTGTGSGILTDKITANTSITTTILTITSSNFGAISASSASFSGTVTFNAFTVTNATTLTGAVSATNASNNIVGIDVAKISGDATAADNAESFFDGTGYAGTNNTIPTVTNVTNAVKVQSGTGSGQLDFTSGVVKANVVQLLDTAWLTPGTAGTPDVNVKLWNGLTTVALPLVPTTAGRTLDVSATGEAGVDWANVGSPTTTVNLSGTNIATNQKVDVDTIKTNPVANAGTVTFPTNSTLASTTNITAGTITTVTTVTNQLTAAQIATGVWQDTVSGDFTTAGSIGKSLFTSGAVPGANGGLFIAGSNAATTVNISGNLSGSVGSVSGLTASNLDTTISSRAATSTGGTIPITGGGLVSSDVTAIATSTTAASLQKSALIGIWIGSVTSGGSTTTLIDSTFTQTETGHFNGRILLMTSGSLKYQAATITAYNAGTKQITFSSLTSAPSNGDTYVIL